MSMFPVVSSNIKGLDHILDQEILIVYFHSGVAYRYKGVPASVITAFRNAPSAGKFYASEIRGKYEGEKIGDEKSA